MALAGIFIHFEAFDWFTAILAMIVIYLLYTSVYLYNYFTDVEEDKLNDKYNPVLNDTYRRIISVYLPIAMISSIIISWKYLGTIALAVALYYLFLGFAYSTPPLRLKRLFLVKNIVIIAGMAPMLFIMTSSLTGTIALLDVVVAAYFGIFGFLGSIVSDLGDFKGDRESGVRTIPVLLGVRGTGHFFLVFTGIQILLIAVPVTLGYISELFLLLLIATPSRLRLTYRVYHLDLQQIKNEPEVPGLVLATIGVAIAGLINSGLIS